MFRHSKCDFNNGAVFPSHLTMRGISQQYKKLLITEYCIILRLQDKIKKNAAELYKQKIQNGNKTALTKRFNDFLLLEKKCKQYK